MINVNLKFLKEKGNEKGKEKENEIRTKNLISTVKHGGDNIMNIMMIKYNNFWSWEIIFLLIIL